MDSIQQRIVKAWHSKYSWALLLYPLSLIFRVIVVVRRFFFRRFSRVKPFSSPVIVVGNISVGGSGKTPLLIGLCKHLIQRGLKVAVISRGYGGTSANYPIQVATDTPAIVCGDEPLLIRQSLPVSDAIVVVDPNRSRAVECALANHQSDIVFCDDGLQHYRLHRDIEIAVIDGARGFGNRQCLPAGPLREPVGRLKTVDFVVVNGDSQLLDNTPVDIVFNIVPNQFRNLATGEVIAIDDWSYSKTVHALAAIGNPQRFADTLVSLGFEPILLGYDDHETMTESDLTFDDDLPVLITAKDAIKLRANNLKHVWVLDVEAEVASAFVDNLLTAVDLKQAN